MRLFALIGAMFWVAADAAVPGGTTEEPLSFEADVEADDRHTTEVTEKTPIASSKEAVETLPCSSDGKVGSVKPTARRKPSRESLKKISNRGIPRRRIPRIEMKTSKSIPSGTVSTPVPSIDRPGSGAYRTMKRIHH
jgi:hypothetical protein